MTALPRASDVRPDWLPETVADPSEAALRGVGQVFFQENALTGALFVLGIALSSPSMAIGAVVGSALGLATARALKFDPGEIRAGIHGFNPALVAIAMLVFFRVGPVSLLLLVAGCVASALVTWLMRKYLPFPTYTLPFIVTTWALVFLGDALGLPRTEAGGPVGPAHFVEATARGIGQVMFQGSLWTGLLFVIGIALNDWRHALWVVAGSLLGMLVGTYHHDSPEEVAALGLHGYNATLAAVALYLSRKSLIPPILGILISVPITEYFPGLGLPTLTTPFVLATWIVLALAWLEARIFGPPAPSHP